MSELNVESVKEFIKGMSLMDAAKLVKALEEELGVSAAAPMGMMAMPGAAAGAGEAAAEEKTEFTVVLADVPADKKIQIIDILSALLIKSVVSDAQGISQ